MIIYELMRLMFCLIESAQPLERHEHALTLDARHYYLSFRFSCFMLRGYRKSHAAAIVSLFADAVSRG
jgi:hypothetical protein